ncbi:hypothetical protein V7I42_00165 [Raoultella ornithinolytica]|uniref:hypothetical protein n=1 Tax=Raoultella ornithinolytica TaxID=54291 RepID=UPI002FF201CE
MKKPRIRICKLKRQYECWALHYFPGEMCHISGYGESPIKAHEDYLRAVRMVENMRKIGYGEGISRNDAELLDERPDL